MVSCCATIYYMLIRKLSRANIDWINVLGTYYLIKGISMRSFFNLLTIIFILTDFFFPLMWGAIVFGVLAIGSSPSGKRADGKSHTGGLLGSMWDDYAISVTMCCPANIAMEWSNVKPINASIVVSG